MLSQYQVSFLLHVLQLYRCYKCSCLDWHACGVLSKVLFMTNSHACLFRWLWVLLQQRPSKKSMAWITLSELHQMFYVSLHITFKTHTGFLHRVWGSNMIGMLLTCHSTLTLALSYFNGWSTKFALHIVLQLVCCFYRPQLWFIQRLGSSERDPICLYLWAERQRDFRLRAPWESDPADLWRGLQWSAAYHHLCPCPLTAPLERLLRTCGLFWWL